MKKFSLASLVVLLIPSTLLSAPVNDDFADRLPLTQSVGVIASNVGGTGEVGEPVHAGAASPLSSVWWSWTAPASGPVEVSTSGSSFDTVLAVYQGTSVGSLSEVASNDDGPFNLTSFVSFNAVGGQSYEIAVDGFGSDEGEVVLQLSGGEANDFRATPEVLGSGGVVSASGDLSGATHEAGEPDLSASSYFYSEPTVWFRWTAPSGAESLRVTLSGLNVPGVLSVYPLGSDSRIALARSSDPVVAYVPVVAGSTYEIRAAVWVDDLFSLPYPEFPDLSFDLGLEAVGAPSTADDYIFRARAQLAAATKIGITAALADLSAALLLEPSNDEALFLRGLVRLLALETEPAFDQLLTDLGVTATGSLREGSLNVVKDAQGVPIPAVGANSSDVVDWVIDHLLPRLSAARSDFEAVSSNTFLSQLSGSETGSDSVLIDRGDLLALAATTHGLEMFFNLIFTYDLSVPLESVATLEQNGQLDAEHTMAAFQNLVDFAATDRRSQFASELTAMRDSYAAASSLIMGRVDQGGFLTGGIGEDPALNTEVGRQLDLGVSSLGGEVDWDGTTVDLSRLVATDQSLRDWLPSLSGDAAVPGTLPDPTFDGILPGRTSRETETIFYKLGRLAGLAEYSSSFGSVLDFLGFPSGPYEDADGDSQTNFEEWLFLTDPLLPDVVFQSLERQQVAPGQSELTFSFIRPIDALAGNWPLVLASSDDLDSWDRTGAKVSVLTVEDNMDGFTETVTYQVTGVDPEQVNNRFFRIEAVYRPAP